MINFDELSCYISSLSKKELTMSECVRKGGVMETAYASLELSKEDIQHIINHASATTINGVFNTLSIIRNNQPADILYKAGLYIIAKYCTFDGSMPRPTVGRCSCCRLVFACPGAICRSSYCKSSNLPNTVEKFCLECKEDIMFFDRGLALFVAEKTPVVMDADEAIKKFYSLVSKKHSGSAIKCYKFAREDSTLRKSLLLYGVRPDKDETYEAYVARVNSLVEKIYEELNPKVSEEKLSDIETVKQIFIKLGHGDMLATSYGGDVTKMARLFFPGKTMAAIAKQFSSKPAIIKVTPKHVFMELKHGDKHADS